MRTVILLIGLVGLCSCLPVSEDHHIKSGQQVMKASDSDHIHLLSIHPFHPTHPFHSIHPIHHKGMI
ncbi:hypothetical protein HHUSO_G2666 [Huso huso]|uniref:Uncharacterized protein n=1 Tax=Huso huso TaxID=61971 RepID=A0ABR1A7U9_HUSHU